MVILLEFICIRLRIITRFVLFVKVTMTKSSLNHPSLKWNSVPHICHGHSSVCMCVFVCICLSVFLCLHVCACACLYVFLHVHVHVRVCVSVYVCLCTCMCVCGWLCRGSRSWRPRCIALCSRSSRHARRWPSR